MASSRMITAYDVNNCGSNSIDMRAKILIGISQYPISHFTHTHTDTSTCKSEPPTAVKYVIKIGLISLETITNTINGHRFHVFVLSFFVVTIANNRFSVENGKIETQSSWNESKKSPQPKFAHEYPRMSCIKTRNEQNNHNQNNLNQNNET